MITMTFENKSNGVRRGQVAIDRTPSLSYRVGGGRVLSSLAVLLCPPSDVIHDMKMLVNVKKEFNRVLNSPLESLE